MREWFQRHIDTLLSALVGVSSLMLYVSTLAPSVLMGDAGEFQFAAPLAGIAHPTGYPLYLILGWLWTTLLPLGSPAYEMNLLSAVFSAAAVALFYLTAQRFVRLAGFIRHPGLTRGIAFLCAALLAVSRTFWSQAVAAEVYALNSLLCVLMLYFALGWMAQRRDWRGLLPLALVFGLGMAHHRTILLWLPAFALFLAIALRDRTDVRLRGRRLALLLAVALAPLVLYLYIPLRAGVTPYLTIPLSDGQILHLYDPTLAGFLDHVLGRAFQGAIRLDLLNAARLRMAWGLFLEQFAVPGALLGLVGVIWLASARRGALLALTLPAYILLTGFNLVYGIGDIHDFYTPTYILWALWVAVGVAWLCRQAGDLLLRWKGAVTRNGLLHFARGITVGMHYFAGWVVLLITFSLPLWLGITNFPQVDRHDDWSAWQYWMGILHQPIPEGAVLVSNDRDEMVPLFYFQHVEGRRPDIIGLFPNIVGDGSWMDLGQVVDQALQSGRPVFLIKPMPGLEVKYRLEPAMGMIRVAGPATSGEPRRKTEAIIADAVRLIGYDHEPYSVMPGQDLTVTLYWQPTRRLGQNYSSFVQLLDGTDNRVAGSDHLPGGDYYPTSLWKTEEVLADTHRFTVPADLPPGPYQLFTGLYLFPSLERLGDAHLGFVGVKAGIETEPKIMPHPAELIFGDVIRFWGYEYRKEGQSILLTLEWQALKEMSVDYTTFIHLIDPAGVIVSQADSQPRGGTYPTSIWDKEEVVIDAYRLPINVDTPPGQYRLVMGLYRLETMERLPIWDAGGNAVGDSVTLAEISWP